MKLITRGVAIVLGNEGRGVSDNLFPNRTVQALTIPMAAAVESLNVAISGSVILAEASARRAGAEVVSSECSR